MDSCDDEEVEPKYALKLYAYCGMSVDLFEGCLTDCQGKAEKRCAAHEGPVTELTPGFRWELETPDDAGSVSDNDGILKIVKVA